MSKVRKLNKFRQLTPDSTLKNRKAGEYGFATFAHLNELGSYMGMEPESISMLSVPFNDNDVIFINKPCGIISCVGVFIPPSGYFRIRLCYDSDAFSRAENKPSRVWGQLTTTGNPSSGLSGIHLSLLQPHSDSKDGCIAVGIFGSPGLSLQFSFCYTIIPLDSTFKICQ